MGFQLRYHEDGTTGLVAVCDVCGALAKGSDANILWLPTGKESQGCFHEYKITCKDQCTKFVDLEKGHQYSQELDTAIGYLINNTRTDMVKARRKMKLLNMIG